MPTEIQDVTPDQSTGNQGVNLDQPDQDNQDLYDDGSYDDGEGPDSGDTGDSPDASKPDLSDLDAPSIPRRRLNEVIEQKKAAEKKAAEAQALADKAQELLLKIAQSQITQKPTEKAAEPVEEDLLGELPSDLEFVPTEMAIHGQTKKGLNKVLTYVKGLEAKVAALEGQVGGVVKETAEQKSARYAQEFETNITALAEKTGVTLTSEQAAEIADEAMIRMDHAKRKGDQVPSIKTLAEKSFKAFIANADDVISHAAADGYSAAVRAQKKGITEKRTGSPTGKTQADYDGMEIRDLARLCVREDAARRSK